MPEVQVRALNLTDLPVLLTIDHSCQTDHVWQMDVQSEGDHFGAIFREIRLPRLVSISYPRPVSELSQSWNRLSEILVSIIDDQVVGYIRTSDAILPHTVWMMDLVVAPRFRRQGVASALVLAAQSWAVQRKISRALIEMPSKNNPAIRLAQKLGYEFCGYNDKYYDSQDIALFFGCFIR